MNAPDWELLERYLADDCEPAEREAVERWLAADPGRRAMVEELRLHGIGERQVPLVVGWGREEVRSRLEREIAAAQRVPGRRPSPPTGVRRPVSFDLPTARPWSRVLRVAAVAAVVVTTATVGWHFVPVSRPAVDLPPTFHLVAAPRGQRLGLRLADGTAVTLAPGSTLRIPSSYGAASRDVFLEGEGMFTVSPDAARPFAVHTARAVARDLGTEFVVRAYEEAIATDVVVSRGLVAVGRAPANGAAVGAGEFGGARLTADSIVIGRGERVRIAEDGALALTRGVALDRYFAWTEGRLVFRDTPLREVVAQLARWHDVDISLGSAAIGDRLLTASFTNESLAETLRVTAAALGVEAVKRGSGYLLRSK